MERLEQAAINSSKPFYRMIPMIVGIVLLISYINVVVPKEALVSIFTGNTLIDPLIAGVFGSILAGNPITSYILGGEFLNLGISLIAITAFLVSWVTVGMIQFPAESYMLGKKFAITRNVLSFIFSIFIAIITVLIINTV
jgi:uncharacterized membrane protein YraQ (UPF0718 family)